MHVPIKRFLACHELYQLYTTSTLIHAGARKRKPRRVIISSENQNKDNIHKMLKMIIFFRHEQIFVITSYYVQQWGAVVLISKVSLNVKTWDDVKMVFQVNATGKICMLGYFIWHITHQDAHYDVTGGNVIMGVLASLENHQPHDCLLNRSFRCRSKKTSKLRITGLCARNSLVTVEFPPQMASNANMFSFDDVIMIKMVPVTQEAEKVLSPI